MKHHNERLHALSRRLAPVWWLTARLLGLDRMGVGAPIPRSILLVDLHLLGDIVMLVPLLRVIRRYHSEAYVGLMAGPWARSILAGTGLVDEFITLRAPWNVKGQGKAGILALLRAVRASRTRAWDWGIDVRGDVRNALLLAVARARRRIAYDFAGGAALLTDVVADDGKLRHIIDHHAGIAEHLNMPMNAEERIPRLQQTETASLGPDARRRIGFHFGASMVLRRMPLEEACALVLRYENLENAHLILVDAPDVAEFNSRLLARLPATYSAKIERWRGDLDDLMSFLRTLDQFYAMDSGPAHIAAALGIDTTVFFGPHLSSAVRPVGNNVTIIERNDVLCRPCDQHRCTNARHQQCLTQLVGFTPLRRSEEQDKTASPIRLALSSLDQ